MTKLTGRTGALRQERSEDSKQRTWNIFSCPISAGAGDSIHLVKERLDKASFGSTKPGLQKFVS